MEALHGVSIHPSSHFNHYGQAITVLEYAVGCNALGAVKFFLEQRQKQHQP